MTIISYLNAANKNFQYFVNDPHKHFVKDLLTLNQRMHQLKNDYLAQFSFDHFLKKQFGEKNVVRMTEVVLPHLDKIKLLFTVQKEAIKEQGKQKTFFSEQQKPSIKKQLRVAQRSKVYSQVAFPILGAVAIGLIGISLYQAAQFPIPIKSASPISPTNPVQIYKDYRFPVRSLESSNAYQENLNSPTYNQLPKAEEISNTVNDAYQIRREEKEFSKSRSNAPPKIQELNNKEFESNSILFSAAGISIATLAAVAFTVAAASRAIFVATDTFKEFEIFTGTCKSPYKSSIKSSIDSQDPLIKPHAETTQNHYSNPLHDRLTPIISELVGSSDEVHNCKNIDEKIIPVDLKNNILKYLRNLEEKLKPAANINELALEDYFTEHFPLLLRNDNFITKKIELMRIQLDRNDLTLKMLDESRLIFIERTNISNYSNALTPESSFEKSEVKSELALSTSSNAPPFFGNSQHASTLNIKQYIAIKSLIKSHKINRLIKQFKSFFKYLNKYLINSENCMEFQTFLTAPFPKLKNEIHKTQISNQTTKQINYRQHPGSPPYEILSTPAKLNKKINSIAQQTACSPSSADQIKNDQFPKEPNFDEEQLKDIKNQFISRSEFKFDELENLFLIIQVALKHDLDNNIEQQKLFEDYQKIILILLKPIFWATSLIKEKRKKDEICKDIYKDFKLATTGLKRLVHANNVNKLSSNDFINYQNAVEKQIGFLKNKTINLNFSAIREENTTNLLTQFPKLYKEALFFINSLALDNEKKFADADILLPCRTFISFKTFVLTYIDYRFRLNEELANFSEKDVKPTSLFNINMLENNKDKEPSSPSNFSPDVTTFTPLKKQITDSPYRGKENIPRPDQ